MRKSINRTTLIIVLAIFLSISIGYALFSDTITIEGTATTAQGDFSLTTTCTTGLPNNVKDALIREDWEFDEGGYLNDSCIVSDDKVTLSVELEKPGSERWFTVQVKNTTSNDVVTEVDENGSIVVDNMITNLKVTDPSSGQVTEKSYAGFELFEDEYIFEFPIMFPSIPGMLLLENGTYVIDYDVYMQREVFYKDGSGKKYFKLSPNESMIIGFKAFWDNSSDAEGNTSETKITIPINFKQLTSDMEVDTDFDPCMFGC